MKGGGYIAGCAGIRGYALLVAGTAIPPRFYTFNVFISISIQLILSFSKGRWIIHCEHQYL